MSWIFLATTSYFFGALTIILDKYLLRSEKISSPPIYAFYVGLAGMGVLAFSPLAFFYPQFALKIISGYEFLLALVSGILFLASITAMYFAIKKSEASRVTPVVYSIIPLVTLSLSWIMGTEIFSGQNIFGIALLIAGGLLVSFDLPLKLKKKKFFAGFYLSIFSGILMGISLLTLKEIYLHQSFFNGFVWSRGGALIGSLLLLLHPLWRKGISKSFTHAHKNKQENLKTGGLFALNKLLGGSSSALINLAIGAGSVTLISSLISIQYVFVLIIAILAGRRLPHIFEERMHFWDWAQKVMAIFIIAVGMFYIFK